MARVLVLYQYFSTRRGSWGTRHHEFGKRWVEHGHDVTVVTSVYDKSDLGSNRFIWTSNVDGIRVIAINIGISNKHGKFRRLLSFAAYSAVSSYFAVAVPADVLIASSGPLTIGIPALLGRWLRRRPLIFEVRDLWPRGPIELGQLTNPVSIAASEWLERLCYRNADVVVALAPTMKDWIQRVAANTTVETITNAADLDLFDPDQPTPLELRERTRGKLCLLYAGTLGRANCGPELLDVAARLKSSGDTTTRLYIAGDGSEREELQLRTTREGLTNVEFLGLLSREEVARWYAVADIVMIGFKPFRALQDTSPNKFFDALAAGKPIVNNTPGWVADLLEAHGCGLNYEPGNVDGAVECIRRLEQSPELRKEMGRRGRSLAQKRFARDTLAAEFSRLLERIALARPGQKVPIETR